MTLTARCPNPACGKTGSIPAHLAGQFVRCPSCQTRFRVAAGPDGSRSGEAVQTGSTDSHSTVRPSSAPPAPAPGRPAVAPSATLPSRIGRFEVRALLGAGAFGAVYRAHDAQLDRDVALKVPHADMLDSPQRVERFLREAKAAARLQHPNVVPVYEAGSDGTHYYIASAFIEGRTLAQAIAEGPLNARTAVRLVRELADALAYVHGMGVVHRDVKPANVLLDKRGRPFLTDFGLAHLETHAERLTRLTQLGSVLGTPAYMPPEQAAGQGSAVQPASDQYSLGVILYQLLCGKLPFEGPPQVVLYHVLNSEPPRPRQLNPNVPPQLEAICLRAMAKRSQDRYRDCQELVDALDSWLAQEQTPAAQHPHAITPAPTAAETVLPLALPVAGPPRRRREQAPASGGAVLRWCQDHPGALLACLLGFILVVTAVGVLLAQLASGPGAPPGPGKFAAPDKKPALQEEPDEFALRLERGRQALKAQRVDEAIDAFATALELRPKDADAEKLLAEARAAQDAELARRKAAEDAEVARRKEQQAKAERDEHRAQLIQHAQRWLAKKEIDAVIQKVAEAGKLSPDDELRLLATELKEAAGKADAKRRRQQAFADYDAAVAAGDRALKLKQFAVAVAHYHDALKVLTEAGLNRKTDPEASDRSERAAAGKAHAQRLAQLQAGPTDLEGTWIVKSLKLEGKDLPLPEQGGKQPALVFSGNKFRALDGGVKGDEEGTFTIDPGKTPRHLDLTSPKDGKVLRMIYRIEGDTLTIGIAGNLDGARPSAFDAKDTASMVLKRAKN